MKKYLFIAALVSILNLQLPSAIAQTGEQQLNNQYRDAIREYLQKDIANRQRTMQRRAEQMLIALPNQQKLYDETYISIRTALVDGTSQDGTAPSATSPRPSSKTSSTTSSAPPSASPSRYSPPPTA